MNGCRLALSKCGNAIATNTASATTFTTTSTALSVALSLVPTTSSEATAKVTSTAGRLITPPACGPTAIACGTCTPRPPRNSTTDPDQPTATALTTSEYSRIRLQPTIQAMPSPSTA